MMESFFIIKELKSQEKIIPFPLIQKTTTRKTSSGFLKFPPSFS
jgi:hypothetical protein